MSKPVLSQTAEFNLRCALRDWDEAIAIAKDAGRADLIKRHSFEAREPRWTEVDAHTKALLRDLRVTLKRVETNDKSQANSGQVHGVVQGRDTVENTAWKSYQCPRCKGRIPDEACPICSGNGIAHEPAPQGIIRCPQCNSTKVMADGRLRGVCNECGHAWDNQYDDYDGLARCVCGHFHSQHDATNDECGAFINAHIGDCPCERFKKA